MTGAADNYATLTFTYDSGGNQTSAATSGPGTGQPSVSLSYQYDPSGRRDADHRQPFERWASRPTATMPTSA